MIDVSDGPRNCHCRGLGPHQFAKGDCYGADTFVAGQLAPTGDRAAEHEATVARLVRLRLRRENLLAYAQFRLEAGDWHGLADAANELRELDVEIRLTK